MAVAMDVTDRSTIKRAHRAIVKALGSVDVIVTTPRILLFESSDVLETPLDGFRATFETNCFGVIEVCREFVPPMAERGYGRVVNVSSGAGQLSRCRRTLPLLDVEVGLECLHADSGADAIGMRASSPTSSIRDGFAPIWADVRRHARSTGSGHDGLACDSSRQWSDGGFFRDRRPIEW
jgi:hypothetical protein